MKVYCENCSYFNYRPHDMGGGQYDCHYPGNMRVEEIKEEENFLHPKRRRKGNTFCGRAEIINKDNDCPDFKR